VSERAVVPNTTAQLGETRFESWLALSAAQISSAHPQRSAVAVATIEQESRERAS